VNVEHVRLSVGDQPPHRRLVQVDVPIHIASPPDGKLYERERARRKHPLASRVGPLTGRRERDVNTSGNKRTLARAMLKVSRTVIDT
jgi:hypothetical protein